jgi:hypothetical protein
MWCFVAISPYLFTKYTVNRKEVIDMAERKTFDVGRDSKTGEFIPVKEAERRPNTTTVERVPKPGYGDTKSK